MHVWGWVALAGCVAGVGLGGWLVWGSQTVRDRRARWALRRDLRRLWW